MTFAVYFLPETTSVPVTLVASSMTWLLVSTSPLEEITMPVPSAVSPLYFSVEVMSTTPGSTLAASADAFREPVPLLAPVPALAPLPPALDEPPPELEPPAPEPALPVGRGSGLPL